MDNFVKQSEAVSSHQVYLLIKSLSQSEKRYFKLTSQKYDKDSNQQIRVFDIMNSQVEYNQVKIWEKIKKHISSEKTFKVIRVSLYNNILKCLRSYPSSTIPIEMEITNSIIDIRFLMDKSLNELAYTMLMKTKKKALENERYIDLIELLRLEKILYENFSSHTESNAEQWEIDIEKALFYVNQFFVAYKADLNIKILTQSENEVRDKKKNKFHELEKNIKILEKIDENQSFEVESIIFLNKQLHIQEIGQHIQERGIDWELIYKNYVEKCEEISKKEKSIFVNTYPFYYIKIYRNLIRASFGTGLEKNYHDSMRRFNRLKFTSEKAEVLKMVYNFTFETLFYYQVGDIKKLRNSAMLSSLFLKNNIIKIGPIDGITLYAQVFRGFAFANELDLAMYYAQKTFESYPNNIRADLQAVAHITFVLISFIQGNTHQINRILKEAELFLIKTEKLYAPELKILRFIKNNINVNSEELSEASDKLISELQILKENKFDSKLFNSFDFISFLQWKYQKKDIGKLLKESHK